MAKTQDKVVINIQLQGQKEIQTFFNNLNTSIQNLNSTVKQFTDKVVFQYINKTKESDTITKTFNKTIVNNGDVLKNTQKVYTDVNKAMDTAKGLVDKYGNSLKTTTESLKAMTKETINVINTKKELANQEKLFQKNLNFGLKEIIKDEKFLEKQRKEAKKKQIQDEKDLDKQKKDASKKEEQAEKAIARLVQDNLKQKARANKELWNLQNQMDKDIQNALKRQAQTEKALAEQKKRDAKEQHQQLIAGFAVLKQSMNDMNFWFSNAVNNIQKVGQSIIDVTSEFESSMRFVNTLTNLSEKAFGDLSKQLIDLALNPAIKETPKELAKAMYLVSTSGYSEDIAKGLKMVEVASKTATAGLSDASTAVRGLTSMMNTYNQKEVKDMIGFSDSLFQTMKYGVYTLETLTNHMAKANAVSATFGLTFDRDVAPALITLTKAGLTASQAEVALYNLVGKLGQPTKEMAQVMKDYNIQINTATLREKGLSWAIQEIIDKTGGSADAFSKLIKEKRAFIGLTVLARNGAKEFNVQMENMKNKTGATENAINQLTKTFKINYKNLLAYIEQLKISFGEELFKTLNPLVEKAKEIVEWFTNINDSTKKMILTTGAFILVAGTLGIAVKSLIFAFKPLVTLLLGLPVIFNSIRLAVNLLLMTGLKPLATMLIVGGVLLAGLEALFLWLHRINGEVQDNKFTKYIQDIENLTKSLQKANLAKRELAKETGTSTKTDAPVTESLKKLKQLQPEYFEITTTTIEKNRTDKQKKLVKDYESIEKNITDMKDNIDNSIEYYRKTAHEASKNLESLNKPIQLKGLDIFKTKELTAKRASDIQIEKTTIDKSAKMIKQLLAEKKAIESYTDAKQKNLDVAMTEVELNSEMNDINKDNLDVLKKTRIEIEKKTLTPRKFELNEAKRAKDEALNMDINYQYRSLDPKSSQYKEAKKLADETIASINENYRLEIIAINKKYDDEEKKQREAKAKKKKAEESKIQKENRVKMETELADLDAKQKKELAILFKGTIPYLEALENFEKSKQKIYEKYKPSLSKAQQANVTKAVGTSQANVITTQKDITNLTEGDISKITGEAQIAENEYNNKKKIHDLSYAEELAYLNKSFDANKKVLVARIKLKEKYNKDDIQAIQELTNQLLMLEDNFNTDRLILEKDLQEKLQKTHEEVKAETIKSTENDLELELKRNHTNLEVRKELLEKIKWYSEQHYITEEFYLNAKNKIGDEELARYKARESERQKLLNKQIRETNKLSKIYQTSFEILSDSLGIFDNLLINNFKNLLDYSKNISNIVNEFKNLNLNINNITEKQKDLKKTYDSSLISLSEYNEELDKTNESLSIQNETGSASFISIISLITQVLSSFIDWAFKSIDATKQLHKELNKTTNDIDKTILSVEKQIKDVSSTPLFGGILMFLNELQNKARGTDSLTKQLDKLIAKKEQLERFEKLSKGLSDINSGMMELNKQLSDTLESQIKIIENQNNISQAKFMTDYYDFYNNIQNLISNATSNDEIDKIRTQWEEYQRLFNQSVTKTQQITQKNIDSAKYELEKSIQEIKNTWLKNEYDRALAERQLAIDEANRIDEKILRETKLLDAEQQFTKKRLELLEYYQDEREKTVQKGYDKEVKLANDYYKTLKKPFEQRVKELNRSLVEEKRAIDDLEQMIKDIGTTKEEKQRAKSQFQTASKSIGSTLDSSFYRQSTKEAEIGVGGFQNQQADIENQFISGSIDETQRLEKLMQLAVKRNLYYQNIASKLVKGTEEQYEWQQKANKEFQDYSSMVFELDKARLEAQKKPHELAVKNLEKEKTLEERKIEDLTWQQEKAIDSIDARYKDLADNFKDNMILATTEWNKEAMSFLENLKNEINDINKTIVRIRAGDKNISGETYTGDKIASSTSQTTAKTSNTTSPSKETVSKALSEETRSDLLGKISMASGNDPKVWEQLSDAYNNRDDSTLMNLAKQYNVSYKLASASTSSTSSPSNSNMYAENYKTASSGSSTAKLTDSSQPYQIPASMTSKSTKDDVIKQIAQAMFDANPKSYETDKDKADRLNRYISDLQNSDRAKIERYAQMYLGNIPFFKNGGVMQHDGLAYLHANERVIPANATNNNSVNINFTGAINANSQTDINNLVNTVKRELARSMNNRI